MKVFLMFLLGGLSALAQTDSASEPAPSSAGAMNPVPQLTPAQIAAYQQRFQQGYALEKQGRFADARAVYEGILAEQPKAKGSLLGAGRTSLELNQPAKADEYLERFHELEPDFPEGYELLIQANQELRKDIKVARLVREFRLLRDSGRVPGFDQSLFFVRERLPLDQGGEVVMTQFFDYSRPPYYTLKAELFGAGHVRQRVLLLKYDPDATAALRQKDAAHAQSSVFILAEPFFTGDRMTRIDVYQEIFVVPEYAKARNTMIATFAAPPKPIYSAAVNAPEPGTVPGGSSAARASH